MVFSTWDRKFIWLRSETLKVLLQCCTLDHLKSTPDLHNDSALLFSPFCFLPRTSPLTFVSPVSSREDVQRPEPVPRLPLGARQLRLGGVGLDRAGELQRSVQGAPPPTLDCCAPRHARLARQQQQQRPGGGMLWRTSRPSRPGISLLQTISYFIAKESCANAGLMTSEEEKHRFQTNLSQSYFFSL